MVKSYTHTFKPAPQFVKIKFEINLEILEYTKWPKCKKQIKPKISLQENIHITATVVLLHRISQDLTLI